jgi:hypothetical protein
MVIFKRNDSSSLWAKRGLLFSLGIDTGLGFILFCIALGISSFYIHWLQTTGLGEFYAPLKEPIQHFLYPIYPYGILFGIVQVLCFGIFRLGMGRPFSTLCSFALMTSSFQLNFLVPSIGRDYLKAPYILTIIFFMGLLVKVPLKGNLAVSLCILAAGIIGHGLGVRQDLLVLIVPFIMVWLFFRPEKIMSNWKQIVIGLVFFLCFLFLSMPQAVRTELHNSASHRLLGGLMRPHNDSLGVTNPGYDWGYLFLDEFIRSNAYVQDKARKLVIHSKMMNLPELVVGTF